MAEYPHDRPTSTTRREYLAVLGAGVLTRLAAGGADGGPTAPRNEATLSTSHEVRIDGETGHLQVAVPREHYRRVTEASHSFSAAFAAAQDQPYLAAVTGDLAASTTDRGGTVLAAQSLAAGITYATDEASTGVVEFVRYPAETLVAGVGDCEDVAILLAGLLARPPLECRTGLLVVPGHCATLVARADLPERLIAAEPVTVTLGGTEYVYVEAVRPVQPGRAAKDYGSRPHVAAYDGRWTVLNAGVLVEWGRDEFDRRGLDPVDAVVG